MGSLQQIIEKYHWEKWFRRDNLIVLVLVGLLLVVVTLPTKEEEPSMVPDFTEEYQKEQTEEIGMVVETKEYASIYEYATYLEEKLEKVLTQMQGVGEVKVMITLETTEEQVVEKDEALVRNNTTEEDAQGGNRTVYQLDSGEETVYKKQGSDESPYVTKTILPKISGVLIVAEGAGKGSVSKSITDIAQALFDIEAHKICVVAKG